MKDVKPIITERLKEACDSAGIKEWGRNGYLSKKLGISQPAVSKWFSGKSLPTVDKIPDLAKLLNVSVEWLVSGKGPRSNQQHFASKEIEKVVQIMEDSSPETQKLIADIAQIININKNKTNS